MSKLPTADEMKKQSDDAMHKAWEQVMADFKKTGLPAPSKAGEMLTKTGFELGWVMSANNSAQYLSTLVMRVINEKEAKMK